MGPRRTASDESWGRPILGGSTRPVYTPLTCSKHTRIYRIYRIEAKELKSIACRAVSLLPSEGCALPLLILVRIFLLRVLCGDAVSAFIPQPRISQSEFLLQTAIEAAIDVAIEAAIETAKCRLRGECG
jgi:hypothetical protein